MQKITDFNDIPQFTKQAAYRVDVPTAHLEHWLDEMAKAGLDLEPEFQRAHVWTEQQQIAYIEYFLRGGRSGRELFFNHPGWMKGFEGVLVIVDGKQRLQAMRQFLGDKIPAFGTLNSQFTGTRSIFINTFVVNINDLETEAEVLQWYLDINAGGTPHTDDELDKVRRMLYNEQEKDNV